MWLPRAKSSTVQVNSKPTYFSCSSFKDIQLLCADDFDSDSHLQPSNSPRASIFHRVRVRSSDSLTRSWTTRLPELDALPSSAEPNVSPPPPSTEATAAAAAQQSELSICLLPGSEKRIVVYFTSLRVVRSTFEDCRSVRSILRGFRVSIDERDVSMDSKFMDELKGILGNHSKAKLKLPRVFIGGRYIGGAEEIWNLHEAGELKKLVEGLPPADPGLCDVYGGFRFILCDDCSGSHKCYSEKGGFRMCVACNENGEDGRVGLLGCERRRTATTVNGEERPAEAPAKTKTSEKGGFRMCVACNENGEDGRVGLFRL